RGLRARDNLKSHHGCNTCNVTHEYRGYHVSPSRMLAGTLTHARLSTTDYRLPTLDYRLPTTIQSAFLRRHTHDSPFRIWRSSRRGCRGPARPCLSAERRFAAYT